MSTNIDIVTPTLREMSVIELECLQQMIAILIVDKKKIKKANYLPIPASPSYDDVVKELEDVERGFKIFLFDKLKHYDNKLIKTGLVLDYFCEYFQEESDRFFKMTVPCGSDVKCCLGHDCKKHLAKFERPTYYVFVASSHFTVCDVCVNRLEVRSVMRNSFKAYVDEYLGTQQ